MTRTTPDALDPSSTTADARETELTAATERLVAYSESLGLADDTLDDAVTDAAMNGDLDALNSTDDEDAQEDIIGGAEHTASAINNEGHHGQIRFLLDDGQPILASEAYVRQLIDAAFAGQGTAPR